MERQAKAHKSYNTLRNYFSISIGSIVAVQREDGWPWTYGMIIDKENQNQNDQLYQVCMTKMGWLITRNSKHVKVTPIISEQYPRDYLSKDRKRHTTWENKSAWKPNTAGQILDLYQNQEQNSNRWHQTLYMTKHKTRHNKWLYS